MSLLKSTLNLAILLLFSFHQLTWAAKPVLIDNEMIESAFQSFQSMSKEEKWKKIDEAMKKRPKSDQKILSDIFSTKNRPAIPDAKFDGEKVITTIEGKTFEFTIQDTNTLVFEGQKVDFSPGKLSEALNKLEQVYSHKSVGIMSLFISEAFAFIPLIYLLWLLGAFLVAIVIAAATSNSAMEQENFLGSLQDKCRNLNSALDGVLSKENSEFEISLIKDKLSAIREKIGTVDIGTGVAAKWAPHSHSTICKIDAGDEQQQKECVAKKRGLFCIEQFEAKLNSARPRSIIGGDRSEGKDIPSRRQPAKSTGPASTKR